MTEEILYRVCGYCRGLKPKSEFIKLSRGRGGRVVMYQCKKCYELRKPSNKETLQSQPPSGFK